jgi:putative glycosyltransferase (TIGR04372 family)
MKTKNSFISKQIYDVKTYGLRELFRKFFLLIKKLISIPIYIIAIVLCIIIRLISPWIIIRVEKFPCNNFGDFVENASLYHCRKALNIDVPKKRYLDFVYIDPNFKIFNKQLAKMWKRKSNFLPGYFLDPINRVSKLIPGWQTHSIEALRTRRSRDVDNLIDKHQPLNFTHEEEIYGKKMLNKFGLKDDDKFICLAIRDSGYQKKKISPRYRDWSYHNYRNQDINNYLLASDELAKRGYYVFRMGVSVEKPLISNNPKIIDYANSNLRSDFMDVYLGAKCSFCISSSFGFDQLPDFFGKPIVFSSIAPLGDMHSYREKDLYLAKHHVLKKEKKRLSLSEIFSQRVAFAYESRIYEENGVELVENTSEEIKDLVIEMDEYLKFDKKLNFEDEELQKSFRNLYTTNLKRFNQRPDSENELWHKQEPGEYAKLHGKVRCRYSSKFLRENKNWLR